MGTFPIWRSAISIQTIKFDLGNQESHYTRKFRLAYLTLIQNDDTSGLYVIAAQDGTRGGRYVGYSSKLPHRQRQHNQLIKTPNDEAKYDEIATYPESSYCIRRLVNFCSNSPSRLQVKHQGQRPVWTYQWTDNVTIGSSSRKHCQWLLTLAFEHTKVGLFKFRAADIQLHLREFASWR